MLRAPVFWRLQTEVADSCREQGGALGSCVTRDDASVKAKVASSSAFFFFFAIVVCLYTLHFPSWFAFVRLLATRLRREHLARPKRTRADCDCECAASSLQLIPLVVFRSSYLARCLLESFAFASLAITPFSDATSLTLCNALLHSSAFAPDLQTLAVWPVHWALGHAVQVQHK